MYTGDDFDYPTTIRGDGERASDALLGIFDVIAPAVIVSHPVMKVTNGRTAVPP